MHLPILLAVLCTQGTADPAQFHPADADLYLEVSDPEALLEAMLTGPLVETFRDEAVRDFVGLVSGMGPFDLDEMLHGLWTSQLPGDVRALLEGLNGLSCSLRMEAGLPEYLVIASFATEEQAGGALEFMNTVDPMQTLGDVEWPNALVLNESLGKGDWVAAQGRFLITGTGDQRNAELLARLTGNGKGIGSHAQFARSNEILGEFGTKTLIRGFARRSPVSILAELLMSIPDAPLEELGMVADWKLFDGTHYFRMGMKNGRYVTECFSPQSKVTSSSKRAIGVAPIDPSLAAAIPTGILGAYATTIDGRQIGSLVSHGLTLLAEQMGETDLLAKLEGELGFPIARLFSHLGNQMTIQTQSIKGPALPEIALWIDLTDPEGFAADLATVAEVMPSMFPGFEARTRTYKVKNQEGERIPFGITSLALPTGLIDLRVPITIQPSVTIANDRLLLGFSSTNVKRELKRLFGPEPPAESEANPWKQAGYVIPDNAYSATFIDWGNQIAGLVSLAKALGPMFGEGIPFDFASLPDGETFVKQFRPTVDFQMNREDGSYRYHEGSFGPELVVFPLAAVLWILPQAQESEPQPVTILEGDFATEIALQQVRSAVTIYRLDRDVFPSSLDDLAEASDAFPDGYLSGGSLPVDGWGNGLVYARNDPGDDGYQLYSKGPNGIDESGSGDDVTVQ